MSIASMMVETRSIVIKILEPTMLDRKQIREEPESVKRAIADKRVSLDLDELLADSAYLIGSLSKRLTLNVEMRVVAWRRRHRLR